MGYDNRAFAYNIHPTNAHNIQEQPMFHHNSRRLVSLLAAVTAASALQTAPALAQGVTALEEVIVTAQRRETLLQDTPIAVTAFSEEKIKDPRHFRHHGYQRPGSQHQHSEAALVQLQHVDLHPRRRQWRDLADGGPQGELLHGRGVHEQDRRRRVRHC